MWCIPDHFGLVVNWFGILRILGVDAKFNCGSMLAASYLLFDMFETREADMNQSKFDMDTFEGANQFPDSSANLI